MANRAKLKCDCISAILAVIPLTSAMASIDFNSALNGLFPSVFSFKESIPEAKKSPIFFRFEPAFAFASAADSSNTVLIIAAFASRNSLKLPQRLSDAGTGLFFSQFPLANS